MLMFMEAPHAYFDVPLRISMSSFDVCVTQPKTVSFSSTATVKAPWPTNRGISIVGTFGTPPTWVSLNFGLTNADVITNAIIIAIVMSLEGIAIAKLLALKHRQDDLDVNQEYVALGIANLFSAFTGGYSISGSFSRSALNDEVGRLAVINAC